MIGVPRALRNRNFVLFLVASRVSDLGAIMTWIALPLVALDRTGSAQTFALLMFAGTFGRWLARPFGGVMADRYDRRRVLAVGQLVLLVAVAAIALGVHNSWWLAVGVAQFTYEFAESLFQGAWSPLQADLLTDDDRHQGNALMSASNSALLLVGPGLGAALYSFTNFGTIVAIDMTTCMIAVIGFAAIRTSAPVAISAAVRASGTSANDWLTELRDGIAATRQDNYLMLDCAASFVIGITNALLMVAAVPWLVETIGAPKTTFGLLLGALGGAGLVCGLVLSAVGERYRPANLLRVAAIMFTLVPIAFLGTPRLWMVFVTFALLGIGESIQQISNTTIEQQRVPSELRGRVGALDGWCFITSNGLTFLVAGVTMDSVGPRTLIVIGAAVWMAFGPMVWTMAQFSEAPAPLELAKV